MADYANEVLVEPEWLEQHLNDDTIRIVEVDENPALYKDAHIPGAIGFDWRLDLQDQVKRDFLGPEEFGALFGSCGKQDQLSQEAQRPGRRSPGGGSSSASHSRGVCRRRAWNSSARSRTIAMTWSRVWSRVSPLKRYRMRTAL